MKSKSGTSRVTLLAIIAAILGLVGGVMYANGLFDKAAQQQAAPHKIVRIGSFSKAIDYAPYLIAKSKGWIDDALAPLDAKAEYVEFQTLPTINEALAASKVDFVFEAEPPAIVARSAGINIRIIAMSCTLSVDAIAPASSPISTILDLKGRKVAVLAGSGAHYGLLSSAKLAGLSDKDITVVDMIPPDAKVAFQTHQIDAWAVWSPWPEAEILSGAAHVISGTKTPIHSILVARTQILYDNKNLATSIVDAIDRAKMWIVENPEQAQMIVASELKLSRDVVKLAWPKNDWNATFTPAVINDFQAKADFLVAQKFIQNQVVVKTDLISPIGNSK